MQAVRKRDGMKTKPPSKGRLENMAGKTRCSLRSTERLSTTVSHSMKFMVVNQWKRTARKGSPEETFQHEIGQNKQENPMRAHHDN
ncbi:hypothetical protein M513_09983, partial [Trichuris suis]